MTILDKLDVLDGDNKLIATVSISSLSVGQNSFRFNENDTIRLKLDPGATSNIKIECYSYNIINLVIDPKTKKARVEKKYQETGSDNLLTLSPGVIYEISNGEEAIGYIPCQSYDLLVDDQKGFFHNYSFYVDLMDDYGADRSITEQGFLNIVKRLDSFIDDLSIDAFKKGKRISKNKEFNENDIFSLNQFLIKTKIKLDGHTRQIQNNLKTTMVSYYANKVGTRKQNFKTVRLNIQHKGQDGRRYSVYKKPSFDTIENRLLKKYLINTRRRLSLLEREVFEVIDTRNSQLEEICIKKVAVFKKKNTKSKMSSKSYLISLENQLVKLQEQEKYLKSQTEFLNVFVENIEHVLKNFNQLVQIPGFNDIKPEKFGLPTRTFQQDPDYNFFKKYSDKIFIGSASFGFQEEEYTLKRTMKLFEIYTFLIIDKTLVDNGYKCCNSNVHGFYDFAENLAEFEYEKEGELIKVNYGYDCVPYRECNDNDMFVSINSRHINPDYLISFYKKETKELKKAYIIDAKYRPFRNIYTADGRTEIQDAADDYLQIAYVNNGNQLKRAVIENVVLIFPDLEERFFGDSFGSICFIGNNPEIEIGNSQSVKGLSGLFFKQDIKK